MSTRSIVAVGLSTFALAVTLVSGCGQASAPETSTLTGTVQQESFAAPVSGITVRSGTTDSTIPVDASGGFTATLAKGASYQLLLQQSGGDVPIVLRRGAGRLDTTVLVTAGGARVDLGQVTYWKGGVVAPPAPSQEAGQVCSDGDGEVDDDGESADDGVDCVDGTDPATGQACDGGPSANQDDGETDDDAEVEDSDLSESDEMGLPENDLPASIGCAGAGDGDGEENDD